MKPDELMEYLLLTSRRILHRQYKYHKISERLSEAEVRNVLAKVLEEKKVYYGIEIPTIKKYVHPDENETRKALVDLVIYDSKRNEKPSIYIELKRGQPSDSKIDKDLRKIFGEPESLKGACFFHILEKQKHKSLNRLERAQTNIFNKYSALLSDLCNKQSRNEKAIRNRWFSLFILDASKRKYIYCQTKNIYKGMPIKEHGEIKNKITSYLSRR